MGSYDYRCIHFSRHRHYHSRALGEYLLAAGIIAAIILIPTPPLVGGNFVAESLIKSLRQAEQQRIDQGVERRTRDASYLRAMDRCAPGSVVHDKVGFEPIANPLQEEYAFVMVVFPRIHPAPERPAFLEAAAALRNSKSTEYFAACGARCACKHFPGNTWDINTVVCKN